MNSKDVAAQSATIANAQEMSQYGVSSESKLDATQNSDAVESGQIVKTFPVLLSNPNKENNTFVLTYRNGLEEEKV